MRQFVASSSDREGNESCGYVLGSIGRRDQWRRPGRRPADTRGTYVRKCAVSAFLISSSPHGTHWNPLFPNLFDIQIGQSPAGGVTLRGNVSGLTPGKHGIHIHEFGDLRDHCRADRTGPHYNPYKVKTNNYYLLPIGHWQKNNRTRSVGWSKSLFCPSAVQSRAARLETAPRRRSGQHRSQIRRHCPIRSDG